jgi:hypothetical protein
MSYEVVDDSPPGMSGFHGLRGLAGLFAPDAYLASGKADTLGKPIEQVSPSIKRANIAPSMLPIFDACNQSADPITCWGQNNTNKPFLGRPYQAEWRAWAAAKAAGLPVPSPGPVVYAPAVEEDNTMLYAGGAIAALLVIGGVLVATSGKKR